MEGETVRLHLYDISGGLAKNLSSVLLGTQVDGLWHTGIVVGGMEYSYGPPFRRFFAGQGPSGAPDKVVDLGLTFIPAAVREDIITNLSTQADTSSYDLLFNNCNHFSNQLSLMLTGTGIPEEVLAQTQTWMNSPLGDFLTYLLQPTTQQPAAATATATADAAGAGAGASTSAPVPEAAPQEADAATASATATATGAPATASATPTATATGAPAPASDDAGMEAYGALLREVIMQVMAQPATRSPATWQALASMVPLLLEAAEALAGRQQEQQEQQQQQEGTEWQGPRQQAGGAGGRRAEAWLRSLMADVASSMSGGFGCGFGARCGMAAMRGCGGGMGAGWQWCRRSPAAAAAGGAGGEPGAGGPAAGQAAGEPGSGGCKEQEEGKGAP
mmetsp:Transcript_20626/g.45172  ORF Transcript_20626/g.45172 Transcript_20626/m.45172 type:complete len:390 (+) Transcript_20626:247-1416(+)